jgi:hypothetical protein
MPRPKHPKEPGHYKGDNRYSPGLIKKHNSPPNYYGKVRNTDSRYHEKYGKRFQFSVNGKNQMGYHYPGRNHNHWSYRSWNSHYRRWLYYDEGTGGYYCWSPSCNSFCPVESADPDEPPDTTGDEAPPDCDCMVPVVTPTRCGCQAAR